MRPTTRYLLAFALISMVLVSIRMGISTRSHTVNVLLFFSSLFACVYLSIGGFRLKPKWVGILIGSILTAPVAVALFAFPLVLVATIWSLNDQVTAPDIVIPMSNEIVCAEYSSGSAITESLERFELSKPILGFLLLRVATTSGPIQEGYSPQEGCSALYKQWISSNELKD